MQKQKNMQANMKLHLHNGQVSNVPQNIPPWTKRYEDTMSHNGQWTMDTMSHKMSKYVYVPQ